mmetsp:Transcript_19793/g.46844  ORF Transcript_19793/g.46844 Transcript_19793/m.46844 type:complete len:251 (-) Transcript_19793:80-832(-)
MIDQHIARDDRFYSMSIDIKEFPTTDGDVLIEHSLQRCNMTNHFANTSSFLGRQMDSIALKLMLKQHGHALFLLGHFCKVRPGCDRYQGTVQRIISIQFGNVIAQKGEGLIGRLTPFSGGMGRPAKLGGINHGADLIGNAIEGVQRIHCGGCGVGSCFAVKCRGKLRTQIVAVGKGGRGEGQEVGRLIQTGNRKETWDGCRSLCITSIAGRYGLDGSFAANVVGGGDTITMPSMCGGGKRTRGVKVTGQT